MGKVFKAFDRFVFNAFDIMGRASRAEFWCVMPVLWIAMLGLFYWDVRGIWYSLDAGEMPSFNPFAYGSFLLIALTAIPRLSLAMRRLQDSGKKAKWAFLPYSALFFGMMGVIGFLFSGALVFETSHGAMPLIADLSSPRGALMTFHNIISNADTIRFVGQVPSPTDLAANLGQNEMGGAAVAIPMLIMLGMMTIYPPLAILFYLLVMAAVSDEDENAYGVPSNLDHGPKQSAKGEHNAFASYAILTKQDRKPTAEEIAARKAAVHSLYEQRVLGRQKQ